MTFALARSLLLADAITPTALAEALFLSATRGTSLVRTLLAARAIDTLRLEQMLERGEAPYMKHIAPVTSLVERLPPGLCDRLLAIPVRRDARTGTVDVAVVDARDPHPAEEIGHWLKMPVRIVRTSIASMESALLRLGDRPAPEPDPGMRPLAPPIWAPPTAPVPAQLLRTPMYGTPAVIPPGAPAPPSGRRPATDPDELAIPLTRRNLDDEPIIDLGPPVVELTRAVEREPVLDLKRRKSSPRLDDPGSSTSLEPVPSSRAPASFVRDAPPTPRDQAPAVLEQMREARDRDQILDLLVAGTRPFAGRAAVLAVRRDGLSGWTGSREIADRKALRAVLLPNTMPTVFHEALEAGEGTPARLVRVPMDAAHAPFIAVMRSPPSGPVVVASVLAEGKPVAVLFADGLADPPAARDRASALVQAAGEGFSRLLRERRDRR